MKKQLKTLTLALALLTITACGQNEVKVTDHIKDGQAEVVHTKETKVASIDSPKAESLEIENKENKEEKENKKDNRNYLIPQTLELKEKEEESKEDEQTANEENELTEIVVEQEQEELIETQEVALSNEDEIALSNEEIELDDQEEVEVEEFAAKEDVQLAEVSEVEELEEPAEIKEDLALIADNKESKELDRKEAEEAEEEVVVASPATTELEKTVEADEVANGLTISSPSLEEVKSYWMNYNSKANQTKDFLGLQLIDQESEEVFASAPNADPNKLNLGEVSKIAEEDALHIANTARFASGIKNELSLGNDQARLAQAAAMVNRLNLEINHYPELPAELDANSEIYNDAKFAAANSNLSAGINLLDSVVEYLKDDLGEANQLEVGHRRWVLNPTTSQVGFGQADEFSAMFVNNDNYEGQNANTVYAYPGETAISEFHSEGSSLSLMFGENFDLTNAAVEVTDLATGEVNRASHIDESFKGNAKAITFGYGMNYEAGTKLHVKVSGVTKDGEEYPVEYTINYMSLR